MLRDTAGQIAIVHAYDASAEEPKLGDAGNIVGYLSQDGAPAEAIDAVYPVELGGGYYAFALTRHETDAAVLVVYAASSTPNVKITGCEHYPDPLLQGTAGQKAILYAHDAIADEPKTGDAANITGWISQDGAAAVATADVHPAEIGGGYYAFDLTADETDASTIVVYGESVTPGVKISGSEYYPEPVAAVSCGEPVGPIATYLATKTGITNLVATRIYKGFLPQKVALPALVIDRVGGEADYHQEGESDLARAEVRITAISTSYGQAKALIEAVRNVLSGLTGTIGTGADATTILSCERDGNEADNLDRPADGSDATIHSIAAVYTIWHRQAVPVLS